jgi:hypothetical protein
MKTKKTLMSLAAAFLAVFLIAGCEPVYEPLKPVPPVEAKVVGDTTQAFEGVSDEELAEILEKLARGNNNPNPEDPGAEDPEIPVASKDDLSLVLTKARSIKEGVYIGTDRDQMPLGAVFVTEDKMEAFLKVIEVADVVALDPAATQEAVDAAAEVLIEAFETFINAKQKGNNPDIKLSNIDALIAAISAANNAKTGINVSSINGAEVDPSEYWVTPAAVEALNAALVKAGKVETNVLATQGEVDEAVSVLKTATSTFTNSKTHGTKANKSALTSAIAEAIAAKEGVVAAAQADDVEQTKFWVTTDVQNTFNGAIAHAALLENEVSATQTQINDEVIALNSAKEIFVNAKKAGTSVGELNAGGFYEANGSGTLISKGRRIPGKIVSNFYVYFENGNDANTGTSPLTPWMSFKNINDPARIFGPGDHILLEADGIFNGDSVDTTNKDTLLTSNKVGMLLIRENSNGAVDNPIIIDLYDIDDLKKPTPTVYWSANKRPIINGHGTPSPGTNPYAQSGAITVLSPDQIEVRNIEVTNSFEFVEATASTYDPNSYYRREVRKALVGIWMVQLRPKTTGTTAKHVEIVNCYAHDVQSEHTNNGNNSYTSNYFGTVSGHASQKIVGGIMINPNGIPPNVGASAVNSVVTEDVLMEGNIVKRTALEGLRTAGSEQGKFVNCIIRGNYIADVAGDGIVIGSAANSLVESNIVKNSCAAPNFVSANYAANWAWYATDTTFQYNETYGTLYGYQDGEAWDVDNKCDHVVYQYNYSHHNPGGSILFMSGSPNSVFRYNISANDAGSSRYMATVASDPKTDTIDTNASSYKAWTNGQTIFHYTNTGTTGDSNKPLIYNNTFYIGDTITCGLFGHNTADAVNKYVRFYNNVIVKAGAGTVYMSYGHSGSGKAGYISNPVGFRNNILWAYDPATPSVGVQSKFNNGSQGMDKLIGVNSNTFKNPDLKIQTTANAEEFGSQRGTVFPEADYANAAKLKEFTSKERLRARASLFTPANNNSPVIEAGMAIPAGPGTQTALDGAWNAAALTEDFFGNAINAAKPPIGAAAKSY